MSIHTPEGDTIVVDEKTAWRAVQRFRKLKPGLQALIRSVARNPRLTLAIEPCGGQTRTSGSKVIISPPIELGLDIPHDRRNCDLRGADRQLICKACRTHEDVLVKLYHECGHHVSESFAKVAESEIRFLVESSIRTLAQEGESKWADAITKKINGMPYSEKSNYFTLASHMSPFLPVLINALEDVRVNRDMFHERPGVQDMFEAWATRHIGQGVETPEGRLTWRDKPLNSQAAVALFAKASGYKFTGWFAPEVEAAIADPTVHGLLLRVQSADSMRAIYGISIPVLNRMRELGFFIDTRNDPEESIPEQPEPPASLNKDPKPDDTDQAEQGQEPSQDDTDSPSDGGQGTEQDDTDQPAQDDTDEQDSSNSDQGDDDDGAQEEGSEGSQAGSDDGSSDESDDAGAEPASGESEGEAGSEGSGSEGTSGSGSDADSAGGDEAAGDADEGSTDGSAGGEASGDESAGDSSNDSDTGGSEGDSGGESDDGGSAADNARESGGSSESGSSGEPGEESDGDAGGSGGEPTSDSGDSGDGEPSDQTDSGSDGDGSPSGDRPDGGDKRTGSAGGDTEAGAGSDTEAGNQRGEGDAGSGGGTTTEPATDDSRGAGGSGDNEERQDQGSGQQEGQRSGAEASADDRGPSSDDRGSDEDGNGADEPANAGEPASATDEPGSEAGSGQSEADSDGSDRANSEAGGESVQDVPSDSDAGDGERSGRGGSLAGESGDEPSDPEDGGDDGLESEDRGPRHESESEQEGEAGVEPADEAEGLTGTGDIDGPPVPYGERGDADTVKSDLADFAGHDAETGDVSEKNAGSGGRGADGRVDNIFKEIAKMIDRAIQQGEAFDAPSEEISGVFIHERDNVGERSRGPWVHMDDERFRQESVQRRLERKGVVIPEKVEEPLLGRALLRTRVTFDNNKRKAQERNHRSGRVNPKVLARRAPLQDDRLFSKTRRPGAKSYHVVIGIDISGSQSNGNLKLTKLAAQAQAELCNRVGVPFEVWAHSGSYSDTAGYDMMVDLVRIKTLEEPWDAKRRERLANLGCFGANLDGHTMEFYRKLLDKSQATDKILMYYTDGAMPAANFDEELEVLQRELNICKRRGYTVMGVGVETDSPTEHGLDTCQIDDMSDLTKVVQFLEKKLEGK